MSNFHMSRQNTIYNLGFTQNVLRSLLCNIRQIKENRITEKKYITILKNIEVSVVNYPRIRVSY